MRVNAQTRERHRRALIESASEAFAQRGFEGAAVDRISEAAGLAKGTIYNYFGSKQAVFEAVLREGCVLASETADEVPADAPTGERLEAFVAANLKWAMQQPALAVVLARELTGGSAESRTLILDAAAACIDKVEAILGDGANAGEIPPPPDSRSMAVTFIALANALMLQASLGGWPAFDALPRAVTQLFLYGISGKSNNHEGDSDG